MSSRDKPDTADVSDHVCEIRKFERFCQKRMSAFCISPLHGAEVRAREHNDSDGTLRVILLAPLQDIETGAVVEMQVHKQEQGKGISLAVLINAITFQITNSVTNRSYCLHRVKNSGAPKHVCKEFNVVRGILDHENDLPRLGRRRCMGIGRGHRGRIP